MKTTIRSALPFMVALALPFACGAATTPATIQSTT
jgi:hypothetical protein